MTSHRSLTKRFLSVIPGLCGIFVSFCAAQTTAPMEELLRPFSWRAIGPAVPGGNRSERGVEIGKRRDDLDARIS
ncbi:MAG: hypothetical protein NTW38_02440 [Candidatus Aminicenantes bacterium]|nr:hypothetical protein [Candidatus Aminicenantes bacterium]